MAWEENSCICLNMQLIAILSRIGVIGIVLCRDADKTYVEYLLQDYTQPMGVATYKVMPEKLKKILPPEEEFKRLLDGKEIDESEI